jgi:hypothetical protein
MKGFHEDFQSDHADQLDLRTQDFDWDEVFRRVDGLKDSLSESDYDRLGTALDEIFRWVIGDPKTPKESERKIGLRFIGLAWCLRPDFFDGSPSLTEIARRIDRNKVTLSVHSADAHRKFGIKNRGQSHGSNFKKTLAAQATTKKGKAPCPMK